MELKLLSMNMIKECPVYQADFNQILLGKYDDKKINNLPSKIEESERKIEEDERVSFNLMNLAELQIINNKEEIAYEQAREIMMNSMERLKNKSYESDNLIKSAYKYSRNKINKESQEGGVVSTKFSYGSRTIASSLAPDFVP